MAHGVRCGALVSGRERESPASRHTRERGYPSPIFPTIEQPESLFAMVFLVCYSLEILVGMSALLVGDLCNQVNGFMLGRVVIGAYAVDCNFLKQVTQPEVASFTYVWAASFFGLLRGE